MMTASQIRAARAALNITRHALADLAGVGVCTLGDMEREKPEHERLVKSERVVRQALEIAGIEFLADGIRWKATPAPSPAKPKPTTGRRAKKSRVKPATP